MIVHSFNGTADPSDADIEPIDELYDQDADLLLVFLVGNGVIFKNRTTDMWYRGSVPDRSWSILGVNETYPGYSSEEAASPLGCLQQYQLCNADEEHCGPVKGWVDVQVDSAPVFNLTEDAELSDSYPSDNPVGERFAWFTAILGYVAKDIPGTISQLSSFSLASQQYMEGGYMAALPDNQWQLDVEHWWATWLAAVQASVVTTAVGTDAKLLQPYTLAPISNYVQETMCNNQVGLKAGIFHAAQLTSSSFLKAELTGFSAQKILTSDYTSFSLFGLYFTYILGTIIVALSYSLDAIQNCRNRRNNARGYQCLEWATNEVLQLQRAAYQGIGTGEWSGFTDDVPITGAGELMGDLPRSHGNNKGSSAEDEEKVGKIDSVTVQITRDSQQSVRSGRQSSEDEHLDSVDDDSETEESIALDTNSSVTHSQEGHGSEERLDHKNAVRHQTVPADHITSEQDVPSGHGR